MNALRKIGLTVVGIAGIVLVFALVTPAAHASPVTINFSGTLSGCTGCNSSAVTGSFTIDQTGANSIAITGFSFSTPFGADSSTDNSSSFFQALSVASSPFNIFRFGFVDQTTSVGMVLQFPSSASFSSAQLIPSLLFTSPGNVPIESELDCGQNTCSSASFQLAVGTGLGFSSASAASATPEPASLLLLGTGLFGVGWWQRRKFALKSE